MSFFFATTAIPFWFLIFVFASATPVWIKIFKKLYRKFKKSGSDDEVKSDVLKKATDHWNANSELSGFTDSVVAKKSKGTRKETDPVKKQNIRSVLKVLAERGETGVLPKSISDQTSISTIDTKNALTYLTEKKYAEMINSTNGTKYYLTALGRQYCIHKKYIE